tara:strand:- start:25840 stop:26259 length:420 start_codon:yes stop_codon:yes gene_type:complete
MTHATCSCGQLRYAISAAPTFHAICHCSDCRAASGRPYVSTAFFASAIVQRTGDVSTSMFESAQGNRTYRDACATCGDMLADRSDGFPDLIGIVATFLDSESASLPQFHMWVGSAVVPIDPEDTLPRFDTAPAPRRKPS